MNKVSIFLAILVVTFLMVGFQKGLFDFSKTVEPDITQVLQSSDNGFLDKNDVTSKVSDNATEGSVIAAKEGPVSNTSLKEFLLFESESAGLLVELESLNDTERGIRLDKYLKALEEFEADGRFMAQEAMLVKIKILELRQLEQSALEEQSTAIVAEYRVRSEQAAKKFADNPSAELLTYKVEAQRIGKEVAAMGDEAFGDGISRNEYLRQQLQNARVKIYAKGPQ